jgi:hypothetical protein
MNDQNPYNPPTAKLTEAPLPRSKIPLYILCALTALQLLDTLRYAKSYIELVRFGAAHFMGLVLGVPGDCCLYLAVILALTKRISSGAFFLAAAIFLGAATPIWKWQYGWGQLILFGCVLSIAGWILTRQNGKSKSTN